MKLPATILPPRMRRHPWEMPWKMLVGLWAFRVAVFVVLWKSHGGTAIGASHSLTVQALFDVVAWLYRRQHTPPEPWAAPESGETTEVDWGPLKMSKGGWNPRPTGPRPSPAPGQAPASSRRVDAGTYISPAGPLPPPPPPAKRVGIGINPPAPANRPAPPPAPPPPLRRPFYADGVPPGVDHVNPDGPWPRH